MQIRVALLSLSLLYLSQNVSPAFGATTPTTPAAANVSQTAAPTAPVFSPDARWVWALLIVIAGLFIASAVIGPIYCMSLPEALPVTHSHDEPPGSSHHHGEGGTVDFHQRTDLSGL